MKIKQEWNQGFAAGASSQRKQMMNSFVELMNSLDSVKGIGEKTKQKVLVAINEKMNK